MTFGVGAAQSCDAPTFNKITPQKQPEEIGERALVLYRPFDPFESVRTSKALIDYKEAAVRGMARSILSMDLQLRSIEKRVERSSNEDLMIPSDEFSDFTMELLLLKRALNHVQAAFDKLFAKDVRPLMQRIVRVKARLDDFEYGGLIDYYSEKNESLHNSDAYMYAIYLERCSS